MPSYFMMNKPTGCITARRDPQGRPTVYQHVPSHFPLLPHVGRLDFNTEGLLLFTDDGRLAQALLNPGFPSRLRPPSPGGQVAEPPELLQEGVATDGPLPPGLVLLPIEKIYRVKVRHLLSPGDPGLVLMEKPYTYRDGTITAPARARFVELRASATWIEVTLHEGRNNQVRRLCARSGFQVVKLRRIQLGPLQLGELKVRWCRPLTQQEVWACYQAALPVDPLPEVLLIDDSPEAHARALALKATREEALSSVDPGPSDPVDVTPPCP